MKYSAYILASGGKCGLAVPPGARHATIDQDYQEYQFSNVRTCVAFISDEV